MTRRQIKTLAKLFAEEMKYRRLEVTKVRSRGGYVRITVSTNPEWYQHLCSQHMGERGQRGGRATRPRTIIRRSGTVSALERLRYRPDCPSVYAERLRDVMAWYIEHAGDPCARVRKRAAACAPF